MRQPFGKNTRDARIQLEIQMNPTPVQPLEYEARQRTKYREVPEPSTRMPSGIPYIVANEFAERFSFYGMTAILVVFMTQHLKNAAGQLAVMSPADADLWFHNFASFVYFTPIVGAL